MSILSDNQRFINIKFHYLEIKNRHITKFKFIHNQEEFERYKNNSNLRELNTGWKILTWAEHSEITSQCSKITTNDEDVEVQETDFIKFRDVKLKSCLKRWDFGSEAGQFVPVEAAKMTRPDAELIELEIETLHGTKTLKLTPDHKVFSKNRGYIRADELDENDELIISV